MWQKMWTPADFDSWATRCGLSLPMTASLLSLTEPTVHRLRKGKVSVKDKHAQRAMEFEKASRTTGGEQGEDLDMFAAEGLFSKHCAALPHAHIATLTSAIARGWTSAETHGWRHMCQPVRMPTPAKVERYDIEWTSSSDLPWGVECRQDAHGNPYRIASMERTVLDLVCEMDTLGEDVVMECIAGAFGRGPQVPDVEAIRAAAKARGGDVLDLVNFYLRPFVG